MAGLGSPSTDRYQGGRGSIGGYQGNQGNRGFGSIGGIRPPTAGGGPVSAPAPRPTPQTFGGPRPMGGPVMSGGGWNASGGLSLGGGPKPTGGGQVSIAPPPPQKSTDISVSSKANPQLDALLGRQQGFVQDLQNNTGLASDATALRTSDAYAGAENAARYAGGLGGSGARQTRQNQLQDSALRENARRQTDLTLGREGMIGQGINAQLGTILGQQSGMLGQQGIGLQAEALRQQQGRDVFNQGLAGQQLQLQAHGMNQNTQGQGFNQQMALLDRGYGQPSYGGGGFGGGGGGGFYGGPSMYGPPQMGGGQAAGPGGGQYRPPAPGTGSTIGLSGGRRL